MTIILKPAKSLLKNLTNEPMVLKNLTSAPTDDDPIIKFASYIEKVNTLAEIEDIIQGLNDATKFNFFKLGGAIVVAQALFNKAKSEFEGLTFREYVEMVYRIPYRKAMRAAEIYRKLVELQIPWSAFGDIGWTKVLTLLAIVTKENVDEWVEKAAHMTVKSLEAAIKELTQPKMVDAGEQEVKSTTTMTFKVHEDQKAVITDAIDKIMAESGTGVKSVALEYMAQNYLGAGIQFKNAEQALKYERKHSDDPALFYQKIVAILNAICPEIIAETTITLKEPAATA